MADVMRFWHMVMLTGSWSFQQIYNDCRETKEANLRSVCKQYLSRGNNNRKTVHATDSDGQLTKIIS